MTPTRQREALPGSVQLVQNPEESRQHLRHIHGLPARTVSEIRHCLEHQFPQLHWVKLYGSRASGQHWRGSDIDLAYSADENCTAALCEALDQLPTPYLFDVTHWESLRHEGLRDHIQRAGKLFP